MERKLVLESCLKRNAWGLLEMYVLLTDNVVRFEMCSEVLDLDTVREHLCPAVDIKLPYKQNQDVFLSLLVARCPVSNSIT